MLLAAQSDPNMEANRLLQAVVNRSKSRLVPPSSIPPEDGGCGARNARQKSTVILHAAPVLVLHVLRFTWDAEQQRPVKRTTRVDFETILPPLTGPSPFDLRAVVEHQGLHSITSAESGHYVAYVRAQDARWYLCSDASAPRECRVQEVRSAQAYMLFYERRG